MRGQDSGEEGARVNSALDYVEKVREMVERRRRPDGWHYDGPHHFLLTHGRAFESAELPPDGMDVIRAATSRRRKLKVRQCFKNAQYAALDDTTGRLLYCEGFATSIIPTHHAWTVLDGRVVADLTWERGHTTTGKLSSKIIGTLGEREYFGVVFSQRTVRDAVLLGEAYGSLLFDYRFDYPLMHQPFVG